MFGFEGKNLIKERKGKFYKGKERKIKFLFKLQNFQEGKYNKGLCVFLVWIGREWKERINFMLK